MKWYMLIIFMFIGVVSSVYAQDIDDDMYFVPSKKKAAKTPTRTVSTNTVAPKVVSRVTAEEDADANVDYHTGQLRDVDDYNRRGNNNNGGQVIARLVNDTLYVTSTDSTNQQQTYVYGNENKSGGGYYEDDNYYEDDYIYTSRLGRYHRVHFIDPWYWDYCYGWYDPWYDPWYGWYAPYYRHGFFTWYDWGWGWHHYPGWDLCWGGHGFYRDHFYYGRGFVHHPITHAYRNGGQRMNGYASRGNRALSVTNLARSGRASGATRANMVTRQGRGGADYNRSAASRGSRVPTTREGNISRTERGTARTERGTSRSESNSRTYSQPSRSSSSYRSSSSSSSPSRGSFGGSFSGGSRGGSFGGGGGFGGGSRGGGRGGR